MMVSSSSTVFPCWIMAVSIAFVVLAASPSHANIGIRPLQSAGVRGHLTCDGRPAVGVRVKLYDKDRFFSMDDKMADGRTDSRGFFELTGSAREVSTIDPKLYIYHDCNDGWKPCQRRFGIMIPDKYVSSGPVPRRLYDVGTIELAGQFSGETRDCIH